MATREKVASFEPTAKGFRGYLALAGLNEDLHDPEAFLEQASQTYAKHVTDLRRLITEIHGLRKARKIIPARKVWEVGDRIFALTDAMARLSIQVDGLYAHLVRDLEVRQKWLEKAVAFRRYLPKKKSIPLKLNWGACRNSPKIVAVQLARTSL